jgi:hypothetical protein
MYKDMYVEAVAGIKARLVKVIHGNTILGASAMHLRNCALLKINCIQHGLYIYI